MPAPKKYPDELRERGVRLVLESQRPIAHVAQDLGVHRETLRLWVRQAQADAGSRSDRLTSDERGACARWSARTESCARPTRSSRPPRCFRQGARPDPIEVSAFIDERKADFGVELIGQTIDVSASAYYQRATGQRCARAVEDQRLVGVIRAVHQANYCAYGYRRMWKALRRGGEDVGRGHVQRLMREHDIQGAKRRGRPWRTTTPDPTARRAVDLVARDFSAPAPDRLWVCDFTYLRCWEGVVFFAFVIDVYSRRIVGWQFAGHMRTDLVLDALRMALAQRGPGADVALSTTVIAAASPDSTGPRNSVCVRGI